MATYNGREVIIERHVVAPDQEKVSIYNKETKETSSVFLKDLILTDDEHAKWLDHTNKALELKTTAWTKRREEYKKHIHDNIAKVKTAWVPKTELKPVEVKPSKVDSKLKVM